MNSIRTHSPLNCPASLRTYTMFWTETSQKNSTLFLQCILLTLKFIVGYSLTQQQGSLRLIGSILSATDFKANDNCASELCLCEVCFNMYQVHPRNRYVCYSFLRRSDGHTSADGKWRHTDRLSNLHIYTLKPNSQHCVIFIHNQHVKSITYMQSPYSMGSGAAEIGMTLSKGLWRLNFFRA